MDSITYCLLEDIGNGLKFVRPLPQLMSKFPNHHYSREKYHTPKEGNHEHLNG